MSEKKIALDKAAILIADTDVMIAEVLKQALYRMGLTNVTRVISAEEAIKALHKKHFDILITEWEMKPTSGLDMVKSIRQLQVPHIAMIPVIMLTARAEKMDVVEARDAGVTEFLVKPFTAKALFNRLEHIIDFPRDFIIAKEFVGHDRRRHRNVETEEEQRKLLPALIIDPQKLNHVDDKQRPYRVVPTHELKKKIGAVNGLSKIITPEILEEAQLQIASFQEESLKWIAEDLKRLETALTIMETADGIHAQEDTKDALLSIKSRAGTFDFLIASEVAFSFYCFLRNKFVYGNEQHRVIISKHLEVLKIVLSRKVTGMGSTLEQQLLEGLNILTHKLQDVNVA